MVWSIIGWTLLGLLGLVVLVLLVPAVCYVAYREGVLTVKARVLFIKLTLIPMKERKPKKERKKKKKPAPAKEKEEKEPEKEQTLEQKLDFVKRIFTAAKETMGFLVRFMRITGFEFQAAVNTGEAADTAILYGRLQGVIGALHALLENTFHIKFKRMVLIPDFAGEYPDSLIFSCKVSVPPVIMLIAAFKGFFNFLGSRPAKQPQPARPKVKQPGAGPQRSDPHAEQ